MRENEAASLFWRKTSIQPWPSDFRNSARDIWSSSTSELLALTAANRETTSLADGFLFDEILRLRVKTIVNVFHNHLYRRRVRRFHKYALGRLAVTAK